MALTRREKAQRKFEQERAEKKKRGQIYEPVIPYEPQGVTATRTYENGEVEVDFSNPAPAPLTGRAHRAMAQRSVR